ncbi:MAG: hypothetical protein EOP53_00095 [Sphingobacteriales bacterium]|nr:MAG: hypothetical protein EOP53_00095 [Sphingobacteriales bacterium]
MKPTTNQRRRFYAGANPSRLFKRLLLTGAVFALFTMLPNLSFAQVASWGLQKQVGEVKAYAKLDSCAGEQGKTFFVKFENTSTATNYEVSYVLSVPGMPTFPPVSGKIIVNAGNSKEGNCQQAPLRGLRMPSQPELNSLSDLTITYTLTKKQ